MKCETIYVVVGRTGEYSDYYEWFVAAYEDESMATEHSTKAVCATKEMGRFDRGGPYDENARQEADYMVCEVPLRTAVPIPQPEDEA